MYARDIGRTPSITIIVGRTDETTALLEFDGVHTAPDVTISDNDGFITVTLTISLSEVNTNEFAESHAAIIHSPIPTDMKYTPSL
jgi:hypothetical protein